MSGISSHLHEVDMIGQLADLKESFYKQTLLISALMELLIEQGVMTREELGSKMRELDCLPPL